MLRLRLRQICFCVFCSVLGNLIGEGGYSEVYKGHLEDGQLIAVKRLIRGSQEEMTADYLSELGILVHVNHPNISRVIGYGVEGGMHLVLPLSVNGSLSSLLKSLFFRLFPTVFAFLLSKNPRF